MMPDLTHPIATGRTAEIYAWEPGTVLKLFRAEFPQGDADYEAKVGRAVGALGIPAPAVIDVVERDGRRGIVYQRVEGRSMLQTLSKQPWRLFELARTLADLHAAMHRQSAPSLPAYRSRLERDIRSAPALPDDLRTKALASLESLPEMDRVCHADFHPDNIILTSSGPVVIDWMTASAGSPWTDVARTWLLLTIGEPLEGTPMRWMIQAVRGAFCRAYMSRYLAHNPDSDQQIAAWLPVIAAARLNEGIREEETVLLEIVRQGLR